MKSPMKNMAYWKSKNGLPGIDNDGIPKKKTTGFPSETETKEGNVSAYIEKNQQYVDKDKTFSRPVHDWSSHYADCWRYVAIANQELDLNQLRPPQKEAAGLHYNPLES